MQILFATLPADGHFNPLTGLAVHLASRGHDVRWYTGPSYAGKLEKLGIPHFPFERANDVNGENLTERYPEYAKLGLGPKAIAFAVEKIFFANLEAHYRDVAELRAGFPFEAIVFDGGFYAGRIIQEKLGVRALAVCPAPTPAPTSRQSPPPMFGLKPARTFIGRIRDRVVTAMLESSMKGGAAIVADLRAREGLPPYRGSLFDFHVDTSELILQVGVPGMDYPRTDWPANVRFVGPMVPHEKPDAALPPSVAGKLDAHPSLIVVSQGTLDNRDPEKLFVPALTALAGTPHLVVATTGGRSTSELRERFPQDNVVVEDWIDFGALMRHADLFISNGGYGSVMRALVHGVPLLVAGKLEGKADINARLDYHGLALDLRTERPTPKQIARGVARVLGEPRFAQNVARVRDELASYDSYAIVEAALTAGQARPVARAAAP